MSPIDIALFFPNLHSFLFCYDSSYAKPTTNWLLIKFAPWFNEERKTKLGIWTRKNDCDNYARAFCVYCQDAHAESANTDEALAVGEFCYISQRAEIGAHAIVCAITNDGLIFIEPQTGERIVLSEKEIASCFRVTF